MGLQTNHWRMFISLERDFRSIRDYVEVHRSNFQTFSIAYFKILLSVGSEIEKLGKEYCTALSSSFAIKDRPNIGDIRTVLLEKRPRFPDVTCSLPDFGIDPIAPWRSWKTEKNPQWWQAYNDAKHNGETFKDGKQIHVLRALAGLFCLNLYYYEEAFAKMENWTPLPELFDHPDIPKSRVTQGGRSLR